MLDWFANAATSIGVAKDISQSLVNLRDAELVRSKVFELTNSLMELQQQLMNAQIEQMGLVKRITELERDIAAQQQKSLVQDRYQLHQFPTGSLAYCLKPEIKDEQPKHFLCANCFEKGDRAILQVAGGRGWGGFNCQRCDKTIVTANVHTARKKSLDR